MALKHATRTLHLATELGEDRLQVTRLEGEEELSRLFRFQLSLVSQDPWIVAEQIVGSNTTVAIEYGDDEFRYFNGVVCRFSAGGMDKKGLRLYQATVVPWLWMLTQTADCRIFQDLTVVEIIEQIFRDMGFHDYAIGKLAGDHPKRNYCVQYRETDFDFVSRLMEEEGLFYFFEHQNGKHICHIADSIAAYRECADSPIDFPSTELVHRAIKPHITGWDHAFQFKPGAWAHTDFNFKKPQVRLMTDEKTVMKFLNVSKFEVFDYPGEFRAKGYGNSLARVRMEEIELGHDMVSGTSNCRAFAPGHRFTVGRHQSMQEEGRSYVINRVRHLAEESNYESQTSLEPGVAYLNHFECFPDSATFRPARSTPKPVVRGCQTAVVTGPPGEEIYTDEHGRVTVQFHWDREGKKDEKSSCWIRVSQIHAGNGWGYMDIPRVGEEVIVDFMEGDPDQPIIVGRVYNGDNKPPYELPAGKTRRGNKTKTYKGAGHNEMSMDDTPGREQIRIHGQHNLDTEVLNDETHTVHNNRTKKIGVDESMTIGNNQTLSVGVDKSVSVGTNHNETIGSNQSISIGSNQSVNIGSKQAISIGKMKNETVGLMSNEMVGATKTTSVGAVYSIISGAAMNTAVGFISAEEVGMTKKIVVGSKLEIIVGASKLVMEAGGKVTIEGTEFLFSASGNVKINGSIIDLN